MASLPASFEDLIKTAERPVLADFYAEWCGPCKVVSPVVESIARDRKGSLLVVKVDIDRKPQVAGAHDVSGVPTLALFWKGRELARLTGAYPRQRIEAELRKAWPADAPAL
ncbi:MAG: thioredoxin [Spirochaetales bacterium]|nr:thioredoxin [Spirochaetales bacterium]